MTIESEAIFEIVCDRCTRRKTVYIQVGASLTEIKDKVKSIGWEMINDNCYCDVCKNNIELGLKATGIMSHVSEEYYYNVDEILVNISNDYIRINSKDEGYVAYDTNITIPREEFKKILDVIKYKWVD